MAISPVAQLRLLLLAGASGLLLFMLWLLLSALCVLLGAFEVSAEAALRYARPLPLLHRPVPLPRGTSRRVWRGFVCGFTELLFCLCFSLSQILLLYAENDGGIRISVPLVALGSFAFFMHVTARARRCASALLAYLLAALWVYLCVLLALPPRLLWRLVRLLLRPVGALYLALLYKHSRALCARQLRLAAHGFEKEKKIEKERVRHGKRLFYALGDPRSDHRDLPGRHGHYRQSLDGMESAPKGKGSAGAANG